MKSGNVLILALVLVSLMPWQRMYSQNMKLYASPRGADVLDQYGDTLLNPWCGGWANPQFSNIDLNGDGRQDIFVFVPGNGANKVLTFLNIGNGQYQYYPEYESFFPSQMQYWALLVDYNKDGKADIFTYSAEGGAIDVYENVSDAGGLKFKKVTYSPNPLRDCICYTAGPNAVYGVFNSTNSLPIIADVDGDGDIDIVAFDPVFYQAYFYKNLAVESGYSLDSIHYNFTNPTKCWGKFATTYVIDSPVKLGVGCGASMKHNAHGASCMLAVDMDNDGDLDLLYGNIFGNQITQMTNGKIGNGKINSKMDTIVYADSGIFGSLKANIPVYPAAYYVDADGDGIPDIVMAPMDALDDTANHKTYLYHNSGNSVPGNHFTYVTDNFLQETMVDDGEHSAPAFVDYNGDGLMDLVIATRANVYGGYSYDHLVLYQNIGTAKKAVYKKIDDDFAHLQQYQIPHLAPTFGDIDGDGKPDMMVGRQDGKVMYYKNMGDSGNTLKMKLISTYFQNIRAGGYSTPCLAHISSDSVYDLVMGRDSGTIIYYQNTGSPKVPVFKKITDSFGHVRTNLYYYSYKSINGKIVDSTLLMQSTGRSSPAIGDFDHNGKLDMVSGSVYGEMFFYFNISDNLNGKFTRTDTVFYNTLKQAKENKLLGLFTMPAAADLDGDQYPDFLIGNDMGGTLYFGSQQVKLGIDRMTTTPYSDAEFNVYPNPASSDVNISFNNVMAYADHLTIINLLGEEVYQGILAPGTTKSQVDVSSFKPGIYFVRVQDSTGRSGVRKLIVQP